MLSLPKTGAARKNDGCFLMTPSIMIVNFLKYQIVMGSYSLKF